jgi:hypothetical protein
MIQNRVYKLKVDALVTKDIPLKASQEIEIVMNVVYINGNMVPPAFQELFFNWVKENPNLFEDDTRNW